MSDPMLIAIVSYVHETRKGPKVSLYVLRGQLAEGDEVEVVHADGTAQRLRFADVGKRPVTAESSAGIGAAFDHGPFKQVGTPEGTYRVGDLLRSPEGASVELGSDSPLAQEVASARSAGRNAAGPHLSDAIVALHIQWMMNQAAKSATGVMAASSAYNSVAAVLNGYGLNEQADRATLLASALLEGYDPSPGVLGLATLGVGVVNAMSFKAPLLVNAIGLAMEEGDAFAVSYRNAIKVPGEAKRVELMEQGRAVALGWCKKCGEVRALDKKFRCEVCRRESEVRRVVVPADRDLAVSELRNQSQALERGLFRR